MENTPAIVEIRDLSKAYYRGSQVVPVLHDISFDIIEGEFLALMGPSGSGKSTLLNLIAGIDEPDSGTIKVGGVDITALPETELARWRAVHVGFIFQFYNLIPVLTAFENVELPLILTPLTRKERKEHVEMALRVVSLTDRMDHYPGQLSGGQQQRVAIARAIVTDHDPRGRRAYRGSRPRLRRRDHGPHRQAQPRIRQDDHHGDARPEGRQEGARHQAPRQGLPQ